VATVTALKPRIVKEELFREPADIVDTMLGINEGFLKDETFTRKAIEELGDPPVCPPSDEHHLYCLMLFPKASLDAGSDLLNYWRAFCAAHGNARKWALFDEFVSDHIVQRRFRPDGPHWAVVELGRMTRGKCVNDAVCLIKQDHWFPLGPEILLIGAVHLKWVEALNGRDFPFLNAPDASIRTCHFESAHFVPHLSRRGSHPEFHVDAPDNMSKEFGTGAFCYY
jgi:hypothetical protein